MKSFIFVACLVVLVGLVAAVQVEPLSEDVHRTLFSAWKAEHGKSYAKLETEKIRFGIFVANLEMIRSHNADDLATFTMKMNHLGDLTATEFKNKYLSSLRPKSFSVNEAHNDVSVAADAIDWRTKAPFPVTPVKDQGQCGSCWAFSAVASMEGAWSIKNNIKAIALSEQEVVDCDTKGNDQGCNGGEMDDAFAFIIKEGGLEAETTYKYTARDGKCKFDKTKVVAHISSYKDVTPKSEAALSNALATVGPISVGVKADAFQFYDSGILSYNSCKATEQELDHGVTAVGFTDKAWIVKNSWGKSWGESGYIRLERVAGNNTTSNTCGILFQPSYPVV